MKLKFILFTFLISIFSNSFATESELESKENETTKKKIIALAPHIVEILYAIDAGDMIVGTTEHADYPAQAKDILRVGGYSGLSIEKIVSLQPDVVIAWKTGNPAEDLARLEELNLNIVYSHPTTPESVINDILVMGGATGKVQEAEDVAKAFKQRLERLENQYKENKGINVFYELWPQPLMTIANDAWPNHLLKLCGVTNVFDDLEGDYPQINLEQVISKDIDVIIQPLSKGQDKEIIEWKKYTHLDAVKNNKVLNFNADKLHRMTPRALDEVELMCKGIVE